MSSTYGENLKLSIFGESHGPAIGMVLDGIPAGLPIDLDSLQQFLNRRAPGLYPWSTSRREEDIPSFLSGIHENFTTGSPIAAMIQNSGYRNEDYSNLKYIPRPGHADYTASIKYDGYHNTAGGGHFSGRLTAPVCIAGGLCKHWLEINGIHIGAHIYQIGNITDSSFDAMKPDLSKIHSDFPVIDQTQGLRMQQLIQDIKEDRDSIGGIIECAVIGLPVGIGEPMFSGIESKIAHIIFGIPAVKELSFGDIIAPENYIGSINNDPFIFENGIIKTTTNHAGGILGGISNGMPMLFRVRIKPTPTIGKPQKTVSLKSKEEQQITIHGRHDPCIVPRAVPVIEAAAAIAIFDLILGNTAHYRRDQHGAF